MPRKKPLARLTDPSTSHEAPANETTRDTLRQGVLRILRKYPDGLTDEQLVTLFDQWHGRRTTATPSGIRSRRAELVDEGLVAAHPSREGITAAGRRCKVWQAVSAA